MFRLVGLPELSGVGLLLAGQTHGQRPPFIEALNGRVSTGVPERERIPSGRSGERTLLLGYSCCAANSTALATPSMT